MNNGTIATHPSGLQIKYDTTAISLFTDAFGNCYTGADEFMNRFDLSLYFEQFPPCNLDYQGQRVIDNCKSQLKTGLAMHNDCQSADEVALFEHAWAQMLELQKVGTVIGVDLIVFSPRYYLAMAIDALLRDNRTGAYILVTFDTQGGSLLEFAGVPALHPVSQLDSCRIVRHGMRLSLAERILKDEGWIQLTDDVQRIVIQLQPGGEWHRTPCRRMEVTECLLWNAVNVPWDAATELLAESGNNNRGQ